MSESTRVPSASARVRQWLAFLDYLIDQEKRLGLHVSPARLAQLRSTILRGVAPEHRAQLAGILDEFGAFATRREQLRLCWTLLAHLTYPMPKRRPGRPPKKKPIIHDPSPQGQVLVRVHRRVKEGRKWTVKRVWVWSQPAWGKQPNIRLHRLMFCLWACLRGRDAKEAVYPPQKAYRLIAEIVGMVGGPHLTPDSVRRAIRRLNASATF